MIRQVCLTLTLIHFKALLIRIHNNLLKKSDLKFYENIKRIAFKCLSCSNFQRSKMFFWRSINYQTLSITTNFSKVNMVYYHLSLGSLYYDTKLKSLTKNLGVKYSHKLLMLSEELLSDVDIVVLIMLRFSLIVVGTLKT